MSTPAVAGRPSASLRRRLADRLAEARVRTLLLTSPLSQHDLEHRHDPLVPPILWELAHIVRFEEYWLVRQVDRLVAGGMPAGLHDPPPTPRAGRDLPLPSFDEWFETMERVRQDALERLERVDLAGPPPLRGGYVYEMVLQHEYEHTESILEALQLKQGEPYPAARTVAPPLGRRIADPGMMARFPGGPVTVGSDDAAVAYDSERPRHTVVLDPFWIDIAPVTNGDFVTFMREGGYVTRRWWSDEGWAWLRAAAVQAPRYWFWEDGEWWTRSMAQEAPIDLTRPVAHLSFYEAEAFAAFAGKRLPTELEWEAAATWDPIAGAARRYPWGNAAPTPDVANLDQLTFAAAPVGAYPGNVSPIGCYGMIGDLWEWTASDFEPYPGFRPFPCRERSEPFLGPVYKVLRGGSWATRAPLARPTHRAWNYPVRRHGFTGFRCARDA